MKPKVERIYHLFCLLNEHVKTEYYQCIMRMVRKENFGHNLEIKR